MGTDTHCTVPQEEKEINGLCLEEMEELAFDLDLKGDKKGCELGEERRGILSRTMLGTGE